MSDEQKAVIHVNRQVKIVNEHCSHLGQTGIVTVVDNSNIPYLVKFENGDEEWYFADDVTEVEPIDSIPTNNVAELQPRADLRELVRLQSLLDKERADNVGLRAELTLARQQRIQVESHALALKNKMLEASKRLPNLHLILSRELEDFASYYNPGAAIIEALKPFADIAKETREGRCSVHDALSVPVLYKWLVAAEKALGVNSAAEPKKDMPMKNKSPNDYLDMAFDELPDTLQATFKNMEPHLWASTDGFMDVVVAWQRGGEVALTQEQVLILGE